MTSRKNGKDSHNANERAVILAARFNDESGFGGMVDETASLARAAGMEVADILVAPIRRIDKNSFVGKGKVEEAKMMLEEQKASTLVLTHTLTDGQHSRLSLASGAQVIDHSGLILTIFERRATTSAGKLQVELAQEMYGRAKLKGAWSHLERQRGALGATGGPGERQLELDRRQVARRIKKLRARLDKIKSHSDLVSNRRRHGPFTVALVGYTNAGKSALFARLSKDKVDSSPRLFETLTTKSRKIHLGQGRRAVLSDTVGFIRSLPHELVDAFRSTLNEALIANLMLVVADVSDPMLLEKLIVIEDTIAGINASHVPKVLVLNKADLANGNILPDLGKWDKIPSLRVSATTGEGIATLRALLNERLPDGQMACQFKQTP